MNDIIVLYKPKGISSNKFLDEVKKITGIKKVGHAGTLDPLAEGVLVVGLGKGGTKKLNLIFKNEKEYEAIVRLGIGSITDDEEGEKIIYRDIQKVSLTDIEKAIKKFVGKIEQLPPKYSAVKYKGREAYKWARQGKEIELKPRPVYIKEIEILDYQWPYLKIRAVTGPGVYIRSLARDLGKELGVGGYIYGLKRTRVGDFDIKNSLTLEELKNKILS